MPETRMGQKACMATEPTITHVSKVTFVQTTTSKPIKVFTNSLTIARLSGKIKSRDTPRIFNILTHGPRTVTGYRRTTQQHSVHVVTVIGPGIRVFRLS